MDKISVPALFSAHHSIAYGIVSEYVYPWLAIPDIEKIIKTLSETLDPDEYINPGENVYVHKTAHIAASALIQGPAIVCEGAEIRHGAYIRGRAIVGRGAVVGNSTEIKNSILFDEVKVPHFNYIGDSLLGHRCHLGAGAVTSNVKSDKSEVVIKYGGGIKTGLKKLGAILGDNCEICCGCILNPGTVACKNVTVYPNLSVRGVIPPDCIYKGGGAIAPKR